MKKAARNHHVSFRINEEDLQKLETAAEQQNTTITDFCRDVVLNAVEKGDYFSHTERVLFEEIARVRYLVGSAFNALSEGKLDTEKWNLAKERVNVEGANLARIVLDFAKRTPEQAREISQKMEQKVKG